MSGKMLEIQHLSPQVSLSLSGGSAEAFYLNANDFITPGSLKRGDTTGC